MTVVDVLGNPCDKSVMPNIFVKFVWQSDQDKNTLILLVQIQCGCVPNVRNIDIYLSRQLIGLSFTICPPLMKSGARYPLTTIKKTGRRGEDMSRPVQFFLSSLPGVYGWVTRTIFGGGQSVK